MKLFAALSLFLSSVAYAASPQVIADYRELRHIPAQYQVIGTVCEQVAKLRLAALWDEDVYEIKIGIGYWTEHRQIGELDVVIFERETGEAVQVGEVKCRRNVSRARSHAEEQLERFRAHVEANHTLFIRDMDDRDHTYNRSQFDEVSEYFTVSQDGGARAGFDMEIGLSIPDVYELQEMLVDCQDRGACARP